MMSLNMSFVICSKYFNIPAPSNRSPPATFKSTKASRGDLLEGAGSMDVMCSINSWDHLKDPARQVCRSLVVNGEACTCPSNIHDTLVLVVVPNKQTNTVLRTRPVVSVIHR